MSKEEKIKCDGGEMVVIDESSNRRTMLRIMHHQIIHIAFDPCMVTKFFHEVLSEKITLNLKNREEPLVYYKSKDKDHWDSYKAQLKKFCKDNRVCLYDNLENK